MKIVGVSEWCYNVCMVLIRGHGRTAIARMVDLETKQVWPETEMDKLLKFLGPWLNYEMTEKETLETLQKFNIVLVDTEIN